MKNVRNLSIVLLVFVVASVNSAIAKNIDTPFKSISLTTAKEIARTQNKYVFIDFYADWCVPCKWMDETTYSDQRISKALKSDFISLKVNIDDFDGYTLKEDYRVNVLPTVVVLDNNGKVIRRFEESMSPSKMNDVLAQLSGKDYKIIEEDNAMINEENIAPGSGSSSSNGNLNDVNNDNNYFDSNVTVETTNSYRVQVGVYTDYANTERIVNEFNSKFDEPIMILNNYLDNTIVYKVVAGDYQDVADARTLKASIEEKMGIKGFVKLFE